MSSVGNLNASVRN